MDIIFVFIGGILGSLSRFWILNLFDNTGANVFGIFIINILGCFFMGLITYIAIKRHNILSDNMCKLLTTGFAGGFTTFSGFTKSMLALVMEHNYIYFLTYVFFNVIIGLIFISWGMNCGYYIMSRLIRTKKIFINKDKL